MKRFLAILTLLTLMLAIVSCGGKIEPGTLEGLSELIQNSRASGAVTTITYDDPEVGEPLHATTQLRIDYTSAKDPLVEFVYSFDRLGRLSANEDFIVTETGTVYGVLDNVGELVDGMHQFVKDNSAISLAKPVVATKKNYTETPAVTKTEGGYRVSATVRDDALTAVFGTDFGGASGVSVVWIFSDTALVSMALAYQLNGVSVSVETTYSYATEVVVIK